MSKNKVEELERLGIGIYLTEEGAELLSKILGEGCPIKMDCGSTEPVKCPYTWANARYASCKLCWKNWLKDFVMKE